MKWIEIDREDVVKGINQFIRNNRDYVINESTAVIYDDEKYPAREIRRIAYFKHFGENIDLSDVPQGIDNAIFFEKLGFDVEYKTVKSESNSNLNSYLKDIEDDSIKPYESLEERIRLVTEGRDVVNTKELENEISNLIKNENLDNFEKKSCALDSNGKKIKIGMYLQTEDVRNKESFDKMKRLVKNSDIDLLVFPETCYVPGVLDTYHLNYDLFTEEGSKVVAEEVGKLAHELGIGVVYGGIDKYGMIFNIFYNPDNDYYTCYTKHTMTSRSLFDPACSDVFDDVNYATNANLCFEPMEYRGWTFGMTICYDCNHAIFSSMYGALKLDVILNSTGGNVQEVKWYKYNKARAIENGVYNLVTMGGEVSEGSVCRTYGFNYNGGEMSCINLDDGGDNEYKAGSINVYVLDREKDELPSVDLTLIQPETVSKLSSSMFDLPVGGMEEVLTIAKPLTDRTYGLSISGKNVLVIKLEGNEILYPEIYLSYMYDNYESVPNKAYILYAKCDELSKDEYEKILSVICKVRAMESYCAVVLESPNYNKVYQTTSNRESQVIMPVDGLFTIDLTRCGGPEVIWKNKDGMRKAWRSGYEWLIDEVNRIIEQNYNEE